MRTPLTLVVCLALTVSCNGNGKSSEGNGPERDNRLCAIHALGTIDGPAATQLVDELGRSKNEDIRDAIRQLVSRD